jgi:Flp pilus assembly protein TadG
VEFALIFPILIVILIGIIEYGSVFNAQLLLTGAAREGVRSMALTGSLPQAQTAAISAATGLAPALTATSVTAVPATCAIGTDVTVTIHYSHPFLTGLFGATIPLTGTATRRCGG